MIEGLCRRNILGPALAVLAATSGGADEIDLYIAAEMAARGIPGLALACGTCCRTPPGEGPTSSSSARSTSVDACS